jgi:hypothetical protein
MHLVVLLAAQLRFTAPGESSIQGFERKLRDHRYYRDLFLGEKAQTIKIPPSPAREYLDFERVKTDNCIVISDIEVPDHNETLLRLALLAAIANGIKDVCFGGDIHATDQDALNSFVSVWRTAEDLDMEGSVGVMRALLREYMEWFTRGWVIEGNHDNRIARATKGEVHLGMFMYDIPIKYSRYPFMYLDTSRGPVKVVHPENFSGDIAALSDLSLQVVGHQCFNSTWDRLIGQVAKHNIGTKQPDGGGIIDQCSRFQRLMMSQMDIATIFLDARVPLAVLVHHALESGGVIPEHPSVHEVLLYRQHAQIVAGVVEAIMVDVVNDETGGRLHDFTMQAEEHFLALYAGTSDDIAFGVETPLILGDPAIILVIDQGIEGATSTVEKRNSLH